MIALLASRLQLETGGPGVLSVTVPVPALVLFLVALVSAIRSRSFRSGATAGAFALVASFVAVVIVVAIEGFEWMARYGVYALDADPPRGPASTLDIVFDLSRPACGSDTWSCGASPYYWEPHSAGGSGSVARTNSGPQHPTTSAPALRKT